MRTIGRKQFQQNILELGFKDVDKNTYRWYINPTFYVDIKFRAYDILFICKVDLGEPKEPLATIEYKRQFHLDDQFIYDKYYLKRFVQSFLSKTIIDHVELSMGTDLIKY